MLEQYLSQDYLEHLEFAYYPVDASNADYSHSLQNITFIRYYIRACINGGTLADLARDWKTIHTEKYLSCNLVKS